MIVLTGTTGGIGGAVLRTILAEDLVPLSSLRISSHRTDGLPKHITDGGIEIRKGDLYHPETLKHAFADAELLFLVSFPSMSEERFPLHRNAIDAAKAAGVKHIIYTSLSFCGGAAGSSSLAQVAQAHLKTEEYLKQSGLTFTILRMAGYFHLWNNFAGFLDLSSPRTASLEAVLPGDGLEHWADRAELGEATARLIANWKDYVNQTINLTGPELLSGSDIIKSYTQATGRQVNIQILPVAEAIEWHKNHGSVPPEQVSFLDNWASWHTAIAAGEKAFLDPSFEKLLGRKPKTLDDLADELFSPNHSLDTKDLVEV